MKPEQITAAIEQHQLEGSLLKAEIYDREQRLKEIGGIIAGFEAALGKSEGQQEKPPGAE